MSHHETRSTTEYAPLGYPQPIPPPQQGYGHPYNPYPNHYNAPAVPPQGTAYFTSAQLPNTTASETTKVYAFARIVLSILIVLMIGTLTFSLITGIIFVTGVPEFKLESFSMPFFEIANSTTLKASWEISIIVRNPNHKLEVLFEGIEGRLSYKEIHLASSNIDPLHLVRNNEGRMKANFANTSSEGLLVNEMGEQRKKGSIDFDFRMYMIARIISGSFWSKKATCVVRCGEVTVNFSSPTGGGTWDGRNGECLTYY